MWQISHPNHPDRRSPPRSTILEALQIAKVGCRVHKVQPGELCWELEAKPIFLEFSRLAALEAVEAFTRTFSEQLPNGCPPVVLGFLQTGSRRLAGASFREATWFAMRAADPSARAAGWAAAYASWNIGTTARVIMGTYWAACWAGSLTSIEQQNEKLERMLRESAKTTFSL